MRELKRKRPWKAALIGSAAVAVALAVVAWTVSDPIVATILGIAVITIALLALASSGGRTCNPVSSPRREGR
jgi:Flp pilus assembly protein TadB